MNLYTVFGYPIDHSLSPIIHDEFGRQLGIPLRYDRRAIPAGQLAEAVTAFQAEGGRGANVTVPLKTEAYALATVLTPRARRAGAVNTLSFMSGEIRGDNTDGAGLVADFSHHSVGLSGSRVLLIGAGGAAQGIAGPLLDAGVAHMEVWNRTPARAEEWLARSDDSRMSLAALEGPYDVVINATAASLGHELPPIPAHVFSHAVAYDLAYGPVADRFLGHARTHGARLTLDGLGMLIEQAALAFFVWHDMRPDTNPVRRLLREKSSRVVS